MPTQRVMSLTFPIRSQAASLRLAGGNVGAFLALAVQPARPRTLPPAVRSHVSSSERPGG